MPGKEPGRADRAEDGHDALTDVAPDAASTLPPDRAAGGFAVASGTGAGRAEMDANALCRALLQPRTPAEMHGLLADLCTPGEIRSLAERWRVARLLEEGRLSYRDIHDETGVSTTTITRVARFLRDEPHGGYRLALARMKETK